MEEHDLHSSNKRDIILISLAFAATLLSFIDMCDEIVRSFCCVLKSDFRVPIICPQNMNCGCLKTQKTAQADSENVHTVQGSESVLK